MMQRRSMDQHAMPCMPARLCLFSLKWERRIERALRAHAAACHLRPPGSADLSMPRVAAREPLPLRLLKPRMLALHWLGFQPSACCVELAAPLPLPFGTPCQSTTTSNAFQS